MRTMYLAIILIAVGAVALLGEHRLGDHQKAFSLDTLIGDRAEAMPDKLQVGDPVEPPSVASSR